MDDDYEHRLHVAAMAWLDRILARDREVVGYDDIAAFTFDGRRIPLMDPQRGIRKPAGLDAALSIRTSYTRPGQPAPYEDAEGPDGLLRYKY